MTYVDGFVAAVPNANREKFIAHSRTMAPILKEFGAISITDCWGDDVPDGEVTSFSMAVQKKDDETVVFSWIVWPDKETRNAGMGRMMSDPRLNSPDMAMPFDGKRLIFGGFVPVMEA